MAHADCHDENSEWQPPNNEDGEWWCESRMGINETRMMYNSISYYLHIWPGPSEYNRPPEEKQYLEFVRNKLFSAICEYNYLFTEAEKEE